MSRSINKCYFFTIKFYLISTYALSDTTCFSSNNISFSKCIKKRSFTMVYMSHNSNYRRSFCKFTCIIFFISRFK